MNIWDEATEECADEPDKHHREAEQHDGQHRRAGIAALPTATTASTA